MQTKAIIQKDGCFIPYQNLHKLYAINEEVNIDFKINDKDPCLLDQPTQIYNYHKMKEDAIINHFNEKIKNQIQYTQDDSERLKKKIGTLMQLQKKHNE